MSSSSAPHPHGVHLVGSIPLSSTEEVFRYIGKTVGDRVLRVPDGETGVRDHFARWQCSLFPEKMQINFTSAYFSSQLTESVSKGEIDNTVLHLEDFRTGYDKAAIESFAIFRKLKDQGVIARHVRFQVSLPTPLNVIVMLRPPYRVAVEPLYEAALLRSLARIQEEIPADELVSPPFSGVLAGAASFTTSASASVFLNVCLRSLSSPENPLFQQSLTHRSLISDSMGHGPRYRDDRGLALVAVMVRWASFQWCDRKSPQNG